MTAFTALCGTMEMQYNVTARENLMEDAAEGGRFLVLTFNGKAEWRCPRLRCIQVLLDART